MFCSYQSQRHGPDHIYVKGKPSACRTTLRTFRQRLIASFASDILRGLLRRVPDLDAVTAYEVGKRDAPDPELLAWAAEAGRIHQWSPLTTSRRHDAISVLSTPSSSI